MATKAKTVKKAAPKKKVTAKATSKKVASPKATAKKVMTTAHDIEMAAEKAAKTVVKKGNAMAKKNPWVLAGITAGLGLAVGMLTRTGKKTSKKK